MADERALALGAERFGCWTVMRVACLAIGYLCGCVLTADIVAFAKTGQVARDMGSGNPGMSNIMGSLGVGWGLVVLAGDIGKVVLPYLACRFLVAPGLGPLCALWVGLGATLGHNYPFWTGFRGGKGVATTSAAIVLFHPLGGFASLLAGLATMTATKQACFGALAIVLAFLPTAWLAAGAEGLALAAALAVLMTLAHGRPMLNAIAGDEPQTDVVAFVKGRLRHGRRG